MAATKKAQASVERPSVSARTLKAQASVEMLVTIGLFIAFTVPILLLLLVTSQYGAENSAILQAQSSSHTLADVVNDVFIEGAGAKKQILINLPANAQSIEIANNEITITLNTRSGGYAAVSPVFANVSDASFRNRIGVVPFVVYNNQGVVKVSIRGG